MKDKLPDTLYLLLKEALTDFYKLEKSPNVKINMDEWYNNDGDVCQVCLAGAVIGSKFINMKKGSFDPSVVKNKKIINKLYVLNFLRLGDIFCAHYMLYDRRPKENIDNSIPVVSYDDNPKEWKKA